MASVRFEGVAKRFGATTVLEGFDLEVADGAFLALLGPSGSGKSTALRLLAGLERPTAGRIIIGDRVVNDLPPRDRDIAMVFQSYALYPHMSVRDNIAFGLKVRGTPGVEITRKIADATALLGIDSLLGRRPAQLSGGQRQRVALARALVREPQVFLLDEPLSNLDAMLRLQTRAEISKLHRRLGTTFVYVTHDQAEAMNMADVVAVLNQGRIQQVGTPQQLYQQPTSMFVAGFMGSPAMNFFSARVQGGAEASLMAGDLRLKLTEPQVAACTASGSQEVVLGVRPEDIYPAGFAPQGSQTAPFRGRVDLVEWLGNEILLRLTLASGEPFLARVDPRLNVRSGDQLDLLVDVERIHLFNATTQERVTGWRNE